YTFGGSEGRETFTIGEPFGAETIKALVSSQPFDSSLSTSRNVEDSRGYLGNLKSATRGIKVGAGSGVAQWAEASAGLATNSKVVVDYNAGLSGTRGLRKLPQSPASSKSIATTGPMG